MDWTIPGTVLTVPAEEMNHIPEKFQAMFLGGGMVLSQVSGVTGLEPHVIQNWVKRGFLTPPQKKRYDLEQLCRIITINMLRSALSLEDICGLLSYINGHLDDESDDMIDDHQLYFLFLRLAAHHRQMNNPAGREEYMDAVMESYQEPVPGAGERVKKVLRIMLTAWAASQLRQTAEKMLAEIKKE